MRGRVRWRRCWSSRRRAVLEHGPEGPVVKAMHGTQAGRFSPIDQKESAVQEPDDRCACGDPAVCATVDGLRCRGCAVRHDLLDHPETVTHDAEYDRQYLHKRTTYLERNRVVQYLVRRAREMLN